jgi:hypothetical protein
MREPDPSSPLAVVPVGPGGDRALIETADLLALRGLGVPSYWFLRYHRVRYHHPIWPRTSVEVARVLLGCQAEQGIKLRDGNPLDLRRKNLIVVKANLETFPLEELVKEFPKRMAQGLVTDGQATAVWAFLERIGNVPQQPS